MAFYNICPYCGANLDPGEQCDCKEQQSERQQAAEKEKEVKTA